MLYQTVPYTDSIVHALGFIPSSCPAWLKLISKTLTARPGEEVPRQAVSGLELDYLRDLRVSRNSRASSTDKPVANSFVSRVIVYVSSPCTLPAPIEDAVISSCSSTLVARSASSKIGSVLMPYHAPREHAHCLAE